VNKIKNYIRINTAKVFTALIAVSALFDITLDIGVLEFVYTLVIA